MQIYELVWVLGIAGLLIYIIFFQEGRWRTTVKVIFALLILLCVFYVWNGYNWEITFPNLW